MTLLVFVQALIRFSVDSADEILNREIRGGNLSDILQAIRYCIDQDIDIAVRTVITAANADTLPDLAKLLARPWCKTMDAETCRRREGKPGSPL